jgi:tRNA(Ile)-lysidine synthase
MARTRGIAFFEDPSNANRRFERVRWRAMMPPLAQAGLDASRLGQLANRIARMHDAVTARAETIWPDILIPEPKADRIAIRFSALRDEPEEIALRVVARALDHFAEDRLARLERLETCLTALREAAAAGNALTRTLSGCMLVLGRDGVLIVGREPERKRGVHPAPS